MPGDPLPIAKIHWNHSTNTAWREPCDKRGIAAPLVEIEMDDKLPEIRNIRWSRYGFNLANREQPAALEPTLGINTTKHPVEPQFCSSKATWYYVTGTTRTRARWVEVPDQKIDSYSAAMTGYPSYSRIQRSQGSRPSVKPTPGVRGSSTE